MPGLKQWTGAAWSDVALGHAEKALVWDGTEFVQVWPVGGGIMRQRMTKVGSQTTAANPIPGWASDPAFPAVIVANKLSVVGAGMVTITASIGRSGNGGGSSAMYVNNVSVGTATWPTFDNSTRTITVTREVADSDLVHLSVSSINVAGPVTAANTWVDVTPV